MKILHIAQWGNSRLYKQVYAQQQHGWDVSVMVGATGSPELHTLMRSSVPYNLTTAMLIAPVFDVVVVHTTIASHAVASAFGTLLSGKAKRLVWDVHDFVNLDGARFYDAVTTPSNGYAKKFANSNAVAHVVYSKVPKDWHPEKPPVRKDVTILMGTLCKTELWGDYSNLELELEDELHVLPSGDDYTGHEHLTILRRRPYFEMLEVMSTYKWSYVGSANRAVRIDDCVTNKFWESLAAGCQLVIRRASEMEALYKCVESIYMEDELKAMERAYATNS